MRWTATQDTRLWRLRFRKSDRPIAQQTTNASDPEKTSGFTEISYAAGRHSILRVPAASSPTRPDLRTQEDGQCLPTEHIWPGTIIQDARQKREAMARNDSPSRPYLAWATKCRRHSPAWTVRSPSEAARAQVENSTIAVMEDAGMRR